MVDEVTRLTPQKAVKYVGAILPQGSWLHVNIDGMGRVARESEKLKDLPFIRHCPNRKTGKGDQ